MLGRSPVVVSASTISDITVEGPSASNSLSFPAVELGYALAWVPMAWQSTEASTSGHIIAAVLNLTDGMIEKRQTIDGTSSAVSPPSLHVLTSSYAWIDCCSQNGSNLLAVTTSNDRGSHFSPNLFAPAGNPQEADIGDDNGNLFLVWRDGPPSQPGDVRFSTLPLGSSTFSSPITLGTSGLDLAIAVGGTSGSVANLFMFVAWTSSTGSLLVRRSLDGGHTFEQAINVDGARSATRSGPRLVHGQHGDVHLVWQSREADGVHLRYALSSGNAQSFGAAVDLDEVPGQSPDLNPSIFAFPTHEVWVAWSSYKDYLTSGRTIRVKTAPETIGSPWSEFQTGANKTSSSDQLSPSFIVDQYGHYVMLYDLVEKTTQPYTHTVHLITSFPIPQPSPPVKQMLGLDPLAAIVAVSGIVAAATLFFILRRRTRRIQDSSGLHEPKT